MLVDEDGTLRTYGEPENKCYDCSNCKSCCKCRFSDRRQCQ